jgi:hypothetical protein
LHPYAFTADQPSGGTHGNIKVPDLLICSMVETLDDRIKKLLVVDLRLDLVDEGLPDARCSSPAAIAGARSF